MELTLFKNGKRFLEKTFTYEDKFEDIVFGNSKIFFGEKSILIDVKKKIGTNALGGIIPDGFLIELNDIDNPEFYLIEVELYKHDFFKHIFPQITKFFAFFNNQKKQDELLDKLYNIIISDDDLKKQIKEHIKSREIFKYLKDMLDNSQNILLILDKEKEELPEIIDTYADTWGKMVKLTIIKEFVSNGDSIYSISPDFENIENVDIIPSDDNVDTNKAKIYTEEYHLDGVSEEVKKIYVYIKEKLVEQKVKFNSQRYYISARIKKNFAYFRIKKKKIRIVVMLPEDMAREKIKSHDVKPLSEAVQNFYNAACCDVVINRNKNLDEVLNVLLETKK